MMENKKLRKFLRRKGLRLRIQRICGEAYLLMPEIVGMLAFVLMIGGWILFIARFRTVACVFLALAAVYYVILRPLLNKDANEEAFVAKCQASMNGFSKHVLRIIAEAKESCPDAKFEDLLNSSELGLLPGEIEAARQMVRHMQVQERTPECGEGGLHHADDGSGG